ncbi:MAG: hypothetical protein P4M11_08870 [Candidatus Pacebacteria bacterium]|nr:hypothetical protein [Candidatus Paceibacterota bacterium]
MPRDSEGHSLICQYSGLALRLPRRPKLNTTRCPLSIDAAGKYATFYSSSPNLTSPVLNPLNAAPMLLPFLLNDISFLLRSR